MPMSTTERIEWERKPSARPPDVNLDKLRSCGWDFYMTGPNEWQWLKFDDQFCTAVQGDATWVRDVRACEEPAS